MNGARGTEHLILTVAVVALAALFALLVLPDVLELVARVQDAFAVQP